MGRLQRVDLRFDTPSLKRSSLIANITTALAQASTRLAAAAQFKFPGKQQPASKRKGRLCGLHAVSIYEGFALIRFDLKLHEEMVQVHAENRCLALQDCLNYDLENL